MVNDTDRFDGIIDKLDVPPTSPGQLDGLTFAVKDMFNVVGYTSGFGNPDWKATHAPAVTNAVAVQQLLATGAHLIANACADELACSLDGINVHYGTPINPQAPDRIPGGSSSGPASLVARGEVDFSLGTDTAGSVRVPASYCGIFGFRPTHDFISSEGVLPLGPSFDTVGVFATSADLLEQVANVLLKMDSSSDVLSNPVSKPISESSPSLDPVTRPNSEQRSRFSSNPNPKSNAGLSSDPGPRPINLILPDQFESVLDPLVVPYMVSFVEALKQNFQTVRYEDLYKLGREVYDVFTIVRAREAWLCHGEWLERVKPNLAPSIRQRIYSCKEISDASFAKASAARAELLEHSDQVVDRNSIICLPTTWGPPPLKSASEGQLQDNRNRNICITTLASCYGFPQVSIPIPVGKMKLGISLIGAKGSDRALLSLVKELTGQHAVSNMS
jgi:amidase